MSKKLAAKASLIQLPPAAPAETVRESGEARAKTAPGTMAHFMASQSAAVKEAEDLREKLKAFDGAVPTVLLDAARVRPSKWANRHAASYADGAFDELKQEIAQAGGNVQPVSVRRLPAGGAQGHELVFGHRRHRACLELGLPLLAMVVEADDRALFEAMERENRARKNLSAWEQGTMYKRALDEGLYPSQRKLAEALGVDVSLVSKSLSLARLPEAVVAAFASPLEIQFRWAQPLAEALQRDPEGVLARAGSLQQGERPPAARVLAALLGQGGALNGSTPRRELIEGADGRQAVLTRDAQGRVTLAFGPGALDDEAQARLAAFARSLLKG